MFKKLLIAVVVMGACFSTVAQNVEGVNARIDAMGGAGYIGDIGWTIGKPSAIPGYADLIQASGIIKPIEGIGESYGAIIAIKSFGENVFFGLTFNNRRTMPGTFFKIAEIFGGFNDNFGGMANCRFFPNLPHANLGFKFGEHTFGIGGFLEASKHDAKHENQFAYTQGGNSAKLTFDSTTFSKYLGIGVNVDARVYAGPVKINPEFRLFKPTLERKLETNIASKLKATNHDVEGANTLVQILDEANTTDGNNLFLRAGAKVSATIQESLWWIVGYWYKNIKFELERNIYTDTVTTASSPDTYLPQASDLQNSFVHNNTYHDLWIALQPLFDDDLNLGIEYSGTLKKIDLKHETLKPDSTKFVLRHIFRLGAEKEVDGFWCFEKFAPRMGLKYTLFQEIWKYKKNQFINNNGDTISINEEIYYPWSSDCEVGFNDAGKGLKIAAGFGLIGKRGRFDISMDVLQWAAGTITGPGASIVSFTLDFGKND